MYTKSSEYVWIKALVPRLNKQILQIYVLIHQFDWLLCNKLELEAMSFVAYPMEIPSSL